MSNVILKSHDLYKTFSQGDLTVDVLRGINLEINIGESIAIIGASGSGKSTLLHLMGGLDLPSSGSVTIGDQKLSSLSEQARGELRNQHMGFIYQFHHLLPEFTAEENVALPLLMGGTSPEKARHSANDILTKVGLGERVRHKPGELSGGERQRAAIARGLVTKPKCLLADEPTGNLDEHTADQVFNLMLELNEDIGTSLIMVTHNQTLAARMNRVYQLHEGMLQQA